MKKTIFFVFTFLCAGCAVVGIVGTPTESEKKVNAEYKFPKLKGEKILVLVDEPKRLDTEVNMRYYLTEAITKNLTGKAGVNSKNIISYKELSRVRSDRPDFSSLSPVEAGKVLDANWVLWVAIQNCRLEEEVAQSGIYKGSLKTSNVIFETATGDRLWPQGTGSKSVRVGFEAESGGRDAAVERLVKASAYCTVRYFYDCPSNEFKISEDMSGVNWEYWQ